MRLYVDIKKKFPGFNLDLNFEAEDKFGLLGASGSGKSMALRCIAGIETPDSGKIILNGRTLFDSEKGINLCTQKRKVGLVFQNYALFPTMTVEQNIAFGLMNKNKAKRSYTVKNLMSMIKLEGMENRYPRQLSGGQQQRVALARALAAAPEALLLDEPFSALDEHLRSYMVRQFSDILSQYQGVSLFISHNMEEAYQLCNKFVVLSAGKIEAQGKKEDIFRNPSTLAVAQLTGCENLSRAQYISPYELAAIDWGIQLKTEKPLNSDIKYVGIYAHLIALSLQEETNSFRCYPTMIRESPFKMMINLSLSDVPTAERKQIQWEVSQEYGMKLKNLMQPWYICLKPEYLMVF